MKLSMTLATSILTLLLGCASSGEPMSPVAPISSERPQHQVVSLIPGKEPDQEKFDFQRRTPLDFLEALKVCAKSRDGYYWFSIHNSHIGWVLESDLPGLIALLHSHEPACYVISTTSSFLPPGHSTVGAEAAYLIDGYRRGAYPQSLFSGLSDRREIRRWWKKHQRQKGG
jgi:hypothetical protein